jgi:hypothetical protein
MESETCLKYEIFTDKSLIVHGDRVKYSEAIKRMGGRWNPRCKFGAGWLLPREKEGELKAFIESNKNQPVVTQVQTNPQPTKGSRSESSAPLKGIDLIKSRTKSRKEQKKYHRAVSDTESDSSEPVQVKKSSSEEEEVKTVKVVSNPEIQVKPVPVEVPETNTKKTDKIRFKSESESDSDSSKSDRPVKNRKEPDRRAEKPVRKSRVSDLDSESESESESDRESKTRARRAPTDRRVNIYVSDSSESYSSSESSGTTSDDGLPTPDTPFRRSHSDRKTSDRKRTDTKGHSERKRSDRGHTDRRRNEYDQLVEKMRHIQRKMETLTVRSPDQDRRKRK